MIVRLIFLAIGAIALVYLYRYIRRPTTAKRNDQSNYTDTVACSGCGLRLPKKDALEYKGKYYCCEEHQPD